MTSTPTKKTKRTPPMDADWLYDAIMEELAPELMTQTFDEGVVLGRHKDETEEEHTMRIASYAIVFDAFESMLSRIERTYINHARKRKEEMQKKLKERERKERAAEQKHAEHLFEE